MSSSSKHRDTPVIDRVSTPPLDGLDTLRRQLDALVQACDSAEKVTSTVLSSKDAVARRLTEAHGQLDQRAAELENREADLKARIAKLEQRAENLDQQRRKLDADREALEIQQQQLAETPVPDHEAQRQQIDAERKQLADQRQAIDAEREQFAADRQTLDGEREQLDQRNAELKAQQDQLAEQRQALDAERQRFASDHEGLDGERGQLAQRQAELKDQQDQLDRQRRAMETDRAALDKERKKLKQLQKQAHDKAVAQRDRLEADRKSLDADRTALQTQRKELDRDRGKLDEARKQFEQHQQRTTEEARTAAAMKMARQPETMDPAPSPFVSDDKATEKPAKTVRSPRGGWLSRIIVNAVLVLMLAGAGAGYYLYRHLAQQQVEQVVAVQQAIATLRDTALLQAASSDIETTGAEYPLAVDRSWFEQLPVNSLTGPEAPWLETVDEQMLNLTNPTVIIADRQYASFWYNPYRGVIRARVPAQLTQSRTVELYNKVNGTSITPGDVLWPD
jgi:hypothetical protein